MTALSDLKQAADQYSRAMESLRQAKDRLSEIIVKYIISCGVDLGKCTELAISENLGLPRSTVRSILLDLVEEGILRTCEFGNTKPYILTDRGIGIAIDWMGLSFTREELWKLLSAKEAEGLKGMLAGAPLVFGEVGGKRIARYRGLAAYICLRTLTGRFLDYVEEGFYERLRLAFGEKTLKELELLNPEIVSFDILTTPSPPVGEWAAKEIQELGEEASPDDLRRAIVESFERNLRYILGRLKKFASLLEKKGYEGLHAQFLGKMPSRDVLIKDSVSPEWKFHDEYLWATTLALREACIVGDKIGIDKGLLEEARLLSEILDVALEKKYMGAKEEGLSLMEWGLKQLQKS